MQPHMRAHKPSYTHCAAQASLVKVVYSKLMQINLTSVTYVQRALIKANTMLHVNARTRCYLISHIMHGHTCMHHACTVACVAAAAPDLRTLAGWVDRTLRHR